MRQRALLVAALALAAPAPVVAQPSASPVENSASYRDDALSIEALINRVYAYPERLPGGRFQLTERLRAEAAAVSDRRALLRFAERALLLLADHHAITGASFASSSAVVPSYADLWIVAVDGHYRIDAVREGSPAAAAGIQPGEEIVAIDGIAMTAAVDAFWDDLGTTGGGVRDAFAARVLAGGRRDRLRRLTVRRGGGPGRTLELPSLYACAHPTAEALTVRRDGTALILRPNDSLGDPALITAFDAAMAGAGPHQRIVIDLRDTPSGGNTSVARAMMGWFVDRPRFYQMHSLPEEQRETGIARQWVEQVLPRAGKHHRGPVEVRVGRWTGSMGEGLAIGFDAIGARVTGSAMAGLLGAITDQRLERSGLIIKLPTERLSHVDGTPRETFRPRR